MIFSDMTNWEREKHTFPAGVRRAIERLQSMDLNELPAGKHDLGEEGMYVLINELETRPWQDIKPESHLLHTDIQLLLSGREQMRVARVSEDQIVSENHYDSQDIAFYSKVHNENAINMVPGDFVVLFPTDIHRPNCSLDEEMPIRKAVVKIHRDVLTSG